MSRPSASVLTSPSNKKNISPSVTRSLTPIRLHMPPLKRDFNPLESTPSAPAQTYPPTNPQKSHRSPSIETRIKRRKIKLPYDTGENVCWITPSQKERVKYYSNRIHVLKNFLSMHKFGEEDIEDPRNFPEWLRKQLKPLIFPPLDNLGKRRTKIIETFLLKDGPREH